VTPSADRHSHKVKGNKAAVRVPLCQILHSGTKKACPTELRVEFWPILKLETVITFSNKQKESNSHQH